MAATTRRTLHKRLVCLWYRRSVLACALLPLGLVYRALSTMYAGLYGRGWLRRVRPRVPVIVIGNISVGGTGKTPLTLWLAQALMARGWTPGIVCRSYRANARTPGLVKPTDAAGARGDEAVLLATRLDCPVWSGPDKAATAVALLAAHPAVDVLICDDGLQHHALAREVEIAVVDAARGLGNRLPLPAGPLRDPPERLATVDAIVINGDAPLREPLPERPRFVMTIEGKRFRSLRDPTRAAGPEQFGNAPIAAIAGIGNPERFFGHLAALGLRFSRHGFPDHHHYDASDLRLPDADVVLMTEKDGIKCAALADDRMWVLPVTARLDEALIELVLARIRASRDAAGCAGMNAKV